MLKSAAWLWTYWVLAASVLSSAQEAGREPRLELFTDRYLIEQLSGDARQVLQKPEPREVVFTTDAPWEGNLSGSYSLFKDGEGYRMYYRAALAAKTRNLQKPEVTCLAESKDGIHWTRPVLNLFESGGSRENNIVWMDESPTISMMVFKDSNPEAPAPARYKAVVQTRKPATFQSPDGVHWTKMADAPILAGRFDSENVGFWDASIGQYRLYWRMDPKTVISLHTATSRDFVHWENEATLTYSGVPKPPRWSDAIQFYTPAIQPYFRAPHLLVGFPTQLLLKANVNLSKQGATQPLLMSSRDGVEFRLWEEPVIPVDAPEDRGGNRSNVMAWGILQLPGEAHQNEMSVYALENYLGDGPSRLRRFVYRLDGLVSIHAGVEGGELLTKPVRLSGKSLVINYKAHQSGMVRIEILNHQNEALEGFTLEACDPLTGDEIAAVVRWKGRNDLSAMARQGEVRLRFVLKNADLYSIAM